MAKQAQKRNLPPREIEFCPVCWADVTGRDLTPETAVKKLSEENKRLRDNIRERDFDEYETPDLYAYWPTTFSVRDHHYSVDWRSPNNMPWYEGRISLMVNYGGGSNYQTLQYVDKQDYAEEVASRLNELVEDRNPGFHWRMGIYFRQVGAHVEIVRRPSEHHFPIMLARIPALEWDSIVGSVARDRALADQVSA